MENINFSYLLIKPDGIPHLKEIIEKLDKESLGNTAYYKVNNWSEIQKNLYEEHYKKKGFSQIYDDFIEREIELYGNSGMLILLGNKTLNRDEFMQKVLEFKKYIRVEFENKEQVLSEKNPQEVDGQNYTIDRGKVYRIFKFDLLHCPDPDISTTLYELKKIYKKGIIKVENKVTLEQIYEYLDSRNGGTSFEREM